MLARAPDTTGTVQFGTLGPIKVKGGNLEEWTGKEAPETVEVTSVKGKHSDALARASTERTRGDVKVKISPATKTGQQLDMGGTLLEIKDARIKGYAVDGDVETWRVADFQAVKRTKITHKVS